MITLFINTCTDNVCLALLKDKKILSVHEQIYNRDMSKHLLFQLNKLFDDENLKINSLNNIVCAVGPGSFTGIRMGVTVTKTLAYALSIPVYPISSLQVMASDSNAIAVPMIDARRDFVYGAIIDEDLNYLKKDTYILKCDLFNEASKYKIVKIDEQNYKVNVEKVVIKALSYQPLTGHQLKPIYLKETQAERELNERNQST